MFKIMFQYCRYSPGRHQSTVKKNSKNSNKKLVKTLKNEFCSNGGMHTRMYGRKLIFQRFDQLSVGKFGNITRSLILVIVII